MENKDEYTDLKTLFERLKTIEYGFFGNDGKPGSHTYPFYWDKNDADYLGYDAIIPGDDTEIQLVGPNRFKVFSYHSDSDFQPFEANSDEVIAFYITEEQKCIIRNREYFLRDAKNN